MPKVESGTEANCWFCNKTFPANEADGFYCYGCDEYVCQLHDAWQGVGRHSVYDHDVGDDEDTEELEDDE